MVNAQILWRRFERRLEEERKEKDQEGKEPSVSPGEKDDKEKEPKGK